MRKLAAATGSALALLCIASPASAALVSEWGFTSFVQWGTSAGQYTFGTGSGSQRVTADVISWGAPCTGTANSTSCRVWSSDGLSVSSNGRSGIRITDGLATGSILTNEGPVTTSTITHYNNSISASRAPLTSATLFATLSLTPDTPEPGWPAMLNFPSIAFAINFVETPNRAGCGEWSSSVCDDIFLLIAGDLTSQFIYGDHLYTLQIVADGLGTLSDAACAVAGADAGCIGLQTQENRANPVRFAFSIAAQRLQIQNLPEPGALALLGIGLAGVALTRRRRG